MEFNYARNVTQENVVMSAEKCTIIFSYKNLIVMEEVLTFNCKNSIMMVNFLK